MNIGIFGAPLDDPNLGCVALCYSALVMLERVSKKYNIKFKYIIFDYSYKEDKFKELCNTLNLDKNSIMYCKRGNMSDPLRMIKYSYGIFRMNMALSKCDAVLDLTEGDSFSDIYGDVIFKGKTNVKLLIERKGIPLIIGPQTIGPFFKNNNKIKAAKAINNASLVMARDELSADCAKELGRMDVEQTIDLAFMLPFYSSKVSGKRLKVGINISSMLFSEKNEMKVQRFILKTDYRTCIESVIDFLIKSDKYDIFLIPHVTLDDKVNQEIKIKYPSVECIYPQSNPVKIKSIISNMDLFIGARMHATIAALSSGVCCIPMSYSRKFTGLFNSIGYKHVIDLEKLDTKSSIALIHDKVKNFGSITNDVSKSNKKALSLSDRTVEVIGNQLSRICLMKNRG